MFFKYLNNLIFSQNDATIKVTNITALIWCKSFLLTKYRKFVKIPPFQIIRNISLKFQKYF